MRTFYLINKIVENDFQGHNYIGRVVDCGYDKTIVKSAIVVVFSIYPHLVLTYAINICSIFAIRFQFAWNGTLHVWCPSNSAFLVFLKGMYRISFSLQ